MNKNARGAIAPFAAALVLCVTTDSNGTENPPANPPNPPTNP